MKNILSGKVLVLNSTYEPLAILPIKKVIKKMVAGSDTFYVEKQSGVYIGQHCELPLPSVIRLRGYVKFKSCPIRVTGKKRKIFQRDQYTCIYCGMAGSNENLTLDHVLPKSRGGDDTSFNLVTACYKCNNAKGDKTPEEAGLRLNKNILKSNINLHSLLSSVRHNPEWKDYLYS
jgi:5-methylcytosine-specific restriction endonuclease McrA